ncbi:MAG: preprotein translocase subunit SecG [Sterolibacteriaceae bacterium]|uniref:Protein-export membrane protein SecG n=1 Tax=Candidatus Methylophosphatis roskildensis TaxID=2899263 RepID=A0A9D7E4F0_9PROT|nr:preprotein translocase subunit SecG [Candidatus Methylophosphatis roskildensis]MBK7234594.1 preprotein translocase subunit SecG [Sterolibacteriaceae bacterium]
MEFAFPLILTIHVIAGLAVIGLVLMQHGKGADMGAAFGSGSSGSLFGASGSANFLSRTTGVLATVFFLTSLGLSHLASSRPKAGGSVMDRLPAQTAPADSKAAEVPVSPTSGAAPAQPAGSTPLPGDLKSKEIPK